MECNLPCSFLAFLYFKSTYFVIYPLLLHITSKTVMIGVAFLCPCYISFIFPLSLCVPNFLLILRLLNSSLVDGTFMSPMSLCFVKVVMPILQYSLSRIISPTIQYCLSLHTFYQYLLKLYLLFFPHF